MNTDVCDRRTIQQTVELEAVTAEELLETYVDAKKHAAAIGEPVTMSRELRPHSTPSRASRVRRKNLLMVARLVVQTWRAEP